MYDFRLIVLVTTSNLIFLGLWLLGTNHVSTGTTGYHDELCTISPSKCIYSWEKLLGGGGERCKYSFQA